MYVYDKKLTSKNTGVVMVTSYTYTVLNDSYKNSYNSYDGM